MRLFAAISAILALVSAIGPAAEALLRTARYLTLYKRLRRNKVCGRPDCQMCYLGQQAITQFFPPA